MTRLRDVDKVIMKALCVGRLCADCPGSGERTARDPTTPSNARVVLWVNIITSSTIYHQDLECDDITVL